MKYLKPLILESKQVGILYHYTTISNLYKILKTNTLKSSEYWDEFNVICCTRNKYFHFDAGYTVPTQTRLVLNGDKLSNIHKIIPYSQDTSVSFEDYEEFGNNWKGDPKKHEKGLLEFEERIIGTVENIDKYIIEVNINEFLFTKNDEIINIIKKICSEKNIKLNKF